MLPSYSLLNKINNFIQTRKEEKFSLNYGLFLLGWKSGLRVSEAISFNYQLKHPRYKDLYLVQGKGNKTRYVYVSSEVISELKTKRWKPNQTTRFTFNNFLKKVKEKMNIPANIELTPHTLRRCFTTYQALKGVPIPVLQKLLGHKNIRTTSLYWKGSIDIREFGGWLEPNTDPERPNEVPKAEINPKFTKVRKIPIQPKITSPAFSSLEKDPVKSKYLKTIAKLKRELVQKDLIITEKDQQITSLTHENENLKAINHVKDKQLAKYKKSNKLLLRDLLKSLKKLKDLAVQNNLLIRNTAKNSSKIKKIQLLVISSKNNNFLLNNLSKIKKPKNNSLTNKEKLKENSQNETQEKLIAEIQVSKDF